MGGHAEALAVGDLDADGSLDLAVAIFGEPRVAILTGLRDGNFSVAHDLSCGLSPHAIEVGDLDGDGQLDIVTGNLLSEDLSVIYRGPGGIFAAEQRIGLDLPVRDLALEDLDLDGFPDLVVAYDELIFTTLDSGRIDVLYGSATGGFLPPRRSWAGSGKVACAVGDVDGDGHRDLVAALTLLDSAAVVWGRGERGFLTRHAVPLMQTPKAFALGDLDGDGVLDLVASTEFTSGPGLGRLMVYPGLGNTEFGPGVFRAAGDKPAGLAIGDVNEDGHPDVVLVDAGAGTVRLYPGDGSGAVPFYPALLMPGLSCSAVALEDVDQDGHLDLIVSPSDSSRTAQVHPGAGDGTFGPEIDDPALAQVFASTQPASALVLEDFDQAGHLDLLLTQSTVFEHNVAFLRGRGDGTFDAAELHLAGHAPRSLTVGDVDSDGLLDLVVGNYGSEDVSLLLGTGAGALAPEQRFPIGKHVGSVSLGDVDLDGESDLFVSSTNEGTSTFLLLGNGDGTFGSAERIELEDHTYAIAGEIADLDGDGAPDLVGIGREEVFSFPNGALE